MIHTKTSPPSQSLNETNQQQPQQQQQPSNSKFIELTMGDTQSFFDGVMSLIGEPDISDLFEAVKKEHFPANRFEADVALEFTTGNYLVTTTTTKEWELVFGPDLQFESLAKYGEGMTERAGFDLSKKDQKRHRIDLHKLKEDMPGLLRERYPELQHVTQEQFDAINLTVLEI